MVGIDLHGYNVLSTPPEVQLSVTYFAYEPHSLPLPSLCILILVLSFVVIKSYT